MVVKFSFFEKQSSENFGGRLNFPTHTALYNKYDNQKERITLPLFLYVHQVATCYSVKVFPIWQW